MNAFDWMLKKTATIPELSPVDEGLFFGHSHSTPSTFKQFHVLVVIVFIYHMLFSKYTNIIYNSNTLLKFFFTVNLSGIRS